MKIIKRPPTVVNYIEVFASSSTAPIDVLGARRDQMTLAIGTHGGDPISVLFGDENLALGDVMILQPGTTLFAIDIATRYMILENPSGLGDSRVSWYVY